MYHGGHLGGKVSALARLLASRPMSALSRRPILVFGLVVAVGIAVWAAATVLIKPDASFVTERACSDDSGFSCVTLRVPRDHGDPDSATGR